MKNDWGRDKHINTQEALKNLNFVDNLGRYIVVWVLGFSTGFLVAIITWFIKLTASR